MTSYRAILFNKQCYTVGDHILDGCKNDHEALEAAKQYVSGCSVQVWKANRLIGRLKEPALEHPKV